MLENNTFDNDLRNRLEGFEAEPPADAWFAIEEAIVVAPQRNIAPLFFRVAAAVAFLAISGLSVWFITSGDQDGTKFAGHQPQSDEVVGDAISGSHSGGTDQTPLATISEDAPALPVQPSTAAGSDRESLAAMSGESLQSASSTDMPVPASDTGPTAVAYDLDLPDDVTGITIPEHIQAAALTALSVDYPASLARISQEVSQASAVLSVNFNGIRQEGISTRRLPNTGVVLGVHMGPQYADRHIAEPSSNLSFGTLESQSLDYGFGITVSVPLSNRISIQTGVGYMNVNQHIKDISAFSHLDNRPFYDTEFSPGLGHPQSILTSFGVIQMDNPVLYFSDNQSSRVLMSNTKIPFDVPDDPKFLLLQGQNLTQFFRFVEVPLILRYRFFDHRFVSLSLKAGVAGNFLIRNDVVMSDIHSNQEFIGETFGVRNFSYSGIGGFAVTFPVTNRLHLFVEPTAQMFLQPIVKNNALPAGEDVSYATGKTYPYCFSINSGISFRF